MLSVRLFIFCAKLPKYGRDSKTQNKKSPRELSEINITEEFILTELIHPEMDSSKIFNHGISSLITFRILWKLSLYNFLNLEDSIMLKYLISLGLILDSSLLQSFMNRYNTLHVRKLQKALKLMNHPFLVQTR